MCVYVPKVGVTGDLQPLQSDYSPLQSSCQMTQAIQQGQLQSTSVLVAGQPSCTRPQVARWLACDKTEGQPMAKHLARAAVVLTALVFATAPAEAAFISGSIDFTGSIRLQGSADVNTATGITFVGLSTETADASSAGKLRRGSGWNACDFPGHQPVWRTGPFTVELHGGYDGLLLRSQIRSM